MPQLTSEWPRTSHITSEARSIAQKHGKQTRQFIVEVAVQLENYYGEEPFNFENIYHAIEQIDTYESLWRSKTAKNFRLAFKAFA